MTPTSTVTVRYRGLEQELTLKHESFHPSGSIKDRTAAGLLMELDRERALIPGTVVVESTSGNLGLGMARLLRQLDCHFIAVVDPKTPAATRESLIAAGVEIRSVDKPDGHGGYLLTRLREVRALCEANPGYRWADQYRNPANPRIHEHTTGPEIAEQGGPGLDAVYVAVSTGGTLAGISAYLRTLDRPIRIVAVDSAGSLVTGDSGGERLIAGIGASRPSSFLTPDSYDSAIQVSSVEMVAVCRIFEADTGVALGGSSGGVVCAYLHDLAARADVRRALGLCADDGRKYRATIYDDEWLARTGITEAVHGTVDRFRAHGLTFRMDGGPFDEPGTR